MRALQMPKLLDQSERLQALRAKAAFHGRQHSFDQAMRKLLKSTDGRIADSIVADLYANWGDPLAPNVEVYLRSCLAEASAADGAILQCGTSLMTLLLGAICDREDSNTKRVWCLEHDEHWANMMRSWLTEYRISKAHLIHAPAETFTGFTWYGIDTDRLRGHMDELLEARAAVPVPKTPLARLEDFTRFHIRFHLARPEAVFVSYMELRNLEPGNFAVIEDLRRRYETELEDILKDGNARGVFALPDTKIATLALIAMLTGVNTWYRAGGRLSQAEVETVYWEMVRKAVAA